MNVIQYLVSKGFQITSDPNTYASGIWGLRNYTVNGYNYDSYSYGYHRAYDFGSRNGDGASIPSVCDGVVVSGTTAWGNFGAQVVILDTAGKYQHIYGHLKRNIPVKVGQRVKKGQTIGYQGNTNYNNVYMASHLHYQVQTAGYRTERAFVTDGINPLNVRYGSVSGSVPTSAQMKVLTYDAAWNWSGKVKITASVNYRIYPHTGAKKQNTIPKGTNLTFDRLYKSNGYWWIRTKYSGGTWFVSLGKADGKTEFLKALDGGKLWAKSVGKIKTNGGKVKGKKNTHTIEDSYESIAKTPSKVVKPKSFNMNVNRGRSLGAYAKGRVDMDNVHIRNRKGSQKTGFNWNTDTGDRLHRNSGEVFIYEIHNGWGRIYTGAKSGYGSNRWVYLGRFIPTYVYK